MQATNQSFAYAFFDDERAAACAVRNLIENGFDSEHIGVLMRSPTETREVALEHKTGVGAGAAVGSLLGVAAGAIALPASGVIAMGGAFAAAGGAAVGGAAGTLLGVLGGLGIWKDKLAVPQKSSRKLKASRPRNERNVSCKNSTSRSTACTDCS